MSDDQKKQSPSSALSSTPTAPPVQQQPPKLPSPVGNPLISRRAFLLGALGASVFLTGLSMVKAGDILGPLIPSPAPAQVVADWNILNQNYSNVLNSSSLYQPIHYSEFFYWPYDSSLSPYYKNIIARLPDAAGTNPLYPGDPILSKVVAFNTTCVHLRCLVNPGYAGNPGSGQFRLQCPCHGSQYDLVTGIPVAGPAFDLGLLPLPQIKLSVDSTGKISAVAINGEPGVGRTQ